MILVIYFSARKQISAFCNCYNYLSLPETDRKWKTYRFFYGSYMKHRKQVLRYLSKKRSKTYCAHDCDEPWVFLSSLCSTHALLLMLREWWLTLLYDHSDSSPLISISLTLPLLPAVDVAGCLVPPLPPPLCFPRFWLTAWPGVWECMSRG